MIQEHTEQRLLRYMKKRGSATRPELAKALDISQVRINQLVSRLRQRGVLKEAGLAASQGGRPGQVYTYQANYGTVAHFRVEPEPPHFLLGKLEWLDMEGELLGEESARFTLLHRESLDVWLERSKGRHLHGICLTPPDLGNAGMEELQAHLHERYGCPVSLLTIAAALCPRKEKTLSLCFQQAKNPQGAYYQGGCILNCGALHLLPSLTPWEQLDYADHTQVEEMVAQIVQSLTCCLEPGQIYLYGDFWTERLERRIRYNIGTKLQKLSRLPKLHFCLMEKEQQAQALRRACIDFSAC